MTVAELVAVIKIKGGKEGNLTLKALTSNFAKTAVKAAASAAAIGGAVTALYQFTKVARDAAMAMDMYEATTGLSAQQLQMLSYKAAQSGVSMKELAGTIQGIQKMTKEVALGRGNVAPFQFFQIDPHQDPTKILDQIGQRIRQWHWTDPGQAKNLADMFGLSNEMYYALLKNETEEMNKQFLLTEKEQKDLVKLNKEWNKVWFYIKQITIKMRGLSTVFQTEFVKILLGAIQGFGELATRVIKFIENSKKAKDILLAIGAVVLAVLGYFHWWLLPLLFIIGALEDIYVFFQGGDSITGQIVDWCKKSEEFKDIWLGIKTVFELAKDAISYFSIKFNDKLLPILQKLSKIKWLTDLLKEIVMQATGLGALGTIGKIRKQYDNLREANSSISKPELSVVRPDNTLNQTNNINFVPSGDGQKDAQTASVYTMNSADAVMKAMYQNGELKYGYNAGV